MNELTIKIEAPGLSDAISRLAAALLDEKALAGIFAAHMTKNQQGTAQPQVLATQPQADAVAPQAVATAPQAPAASVPPVAAVPVPPVAAPQAPTVPVPPMSAASVSPVAASTAPAVPLSGAPTYTLDQISKAGATLVDSGKMGQLLALLARYGVQAVTQLPQEQYGAFATELRALGAQF